jgi:tRNA pseudouridine38-40 synthase
MTRWLVQFGYDGRPFAGWARQPRLRTVEGAIREGLVRCGVVDSVEAAHLQVASRTDRGVSARGNALALESRRSGRELLRTLNAIAPEIFFLRAVAIPESFRVRSARSREYRYFLDRNEPGVAEWDALALAFTGGPIDIRSFARSAPAHGPSWRTVDRIGILQGPSGPQLQIVARGFAWGMIRKMVQAFREVASGALSPVHLREAIRGDRRLPLALAPPEPLVLWEVDYDLVWEHLSPGAPARQTRYFRSQWAEATARTAVLAELIELPPRSSERSRSERSPRAVSNAGAR